MLAAVICTGYVCAVVDCLDGVALCPMTHSHTHYCSDCASNCSPPTSCPYSHGQQTVVVVNDILENVLTK